MCLRCAAGADSSPRLVFLLPDQVHNDEPGDDEQPQQNQNQQNHHRTVTTCTSTPAYPRIHATKPICRLTYGKDSAQGAQLYNYDGGFTGTIARGRSRTAKYDYGIKGRKNLDDLLVEVIQSFEHDSAIFVDAAK